MLGPALEVARLWRVQQLHRTRLVRLLLLRSRPPLHRHRTALLLPQRSRLLQPPVAPPLQWHCYLPGRAHPAAGNFRLRRPMTAQATAAPWQVRATMSRRLIRVCRQLELRWRCDQQWRAGGSVVATCLSEFLEFAAALAEYEEAAKKAAAKADGGAAVCEAEPEEAGAGGAGAGAAFAAKRKGSAASVASSASAVASSAGGDSSDSSSDSDYVDDGEAGESLSRCSSAHQACCVSRFHGCCTGNQQRCCSSRSNWRGCRCRGCIGRCRHRLPQAEMARHQQAGTGASKRQRTGDGSGGASSGLKPTKLSEAAQLCGQRRR